MQVRLSGILVCRGCLVAPTIKYMQVTGDSFEVSSGLTAVWIICIQAEIYESMQLAGFLSTTSPVIIQRR